MAAVWAPPERHEVTYTGQGSTTVLRISPYRGGDRSRPAVICLHGMAVWDPNPPPTNLLMTQLGTWHSMAASAGINGLLQAGYRLYCPFTGPNWCAPTCAYTGGTGTAAIDDAFTLAVADGHPSNGVLLYGISGGGGNFFTWSMTHPNQFLGGYGVSALCDIVDAHSRTFTYPLSTSIEYQWGAGWNAASASVDPQRNHASIAPVASRIKCVWGTDDTVVSYASTLTMATAIPALTVQWVSGGGHFTFADATYNEYDITNWFDYLIGRTS